MTKAQGFYGFFAIAIILIIGFWVADASTHGLSDEENIWYPIILAVFVLIPALAWLFHDRKRV